MKKFNTNYLIIGIITTLIIATIGVTYAYWKGVIQGSGAEIAVNIDTANIVFTDTQELVETNVRPGWSTTKTFTIENEGDTPFEFDIYIEGFVNTLVTEGFLQYQITSTNGYNMEEFKPLPKSNEPTDTTLVYSINIDARVLQEYTIIFRYVDSPTVDQSEDMGKTVSGRLMIREGTVDPNVKYTVTINAENALVDENPQETIKYGSVEFEVTPDEGYELSDTVICDNEAKGIIEGNKVTVNNVTSDTTCILSNDLKTYAVNVTSTNNNYGTVSPTSQSVEHGSNATITLNPTIHYHYSSNTCGGTVSDNVMTISNVTNSKTCTITFEEDTKYTVSVSVSGGSASPSSRTVYSGESTTFSISTNSGYTTSGATVSGDGCSLSGSTLMVSNVTSNLTCIVIMNEIKIITVSGWGIEEQKVDCTNYCILTSDHTANPELRCNLSGTQWPYGVNGEREGTRWKVYGSSLVNGETCYFCGTNGSGYYCSIYH